MLVGRIIFLSHVTFIVTYFLFMIDRNLGPNLDGMHTATLEVGVPLPAPEEIGEVVVRGVSTVDYNVGDHEMSKTEETYRAIFVGRLSDIGLGNPEGIPSGLAEASDQELAAYAESLLEQLEEPEDLTADSCIDGREIMGCSDSSAPVLRLRRVGNSAANMGVGLNGGVLTVNDLPEGDIMTQAAYVDEKSGRKRCSHTGGCGGANGEISDNESIYGKDTIENAAETLMGIPEVAKALGTSYNATIAGEVRANARVTAEYERKKGWVGQNYVDSVMSDSPAMVDQLVVDPEDHKFHGHKENAVVIIIGDKTLRAGNFVWNLTASNKAVEGLTKDADEATKQRTMLAEVMKHLAVADRLPSNKTPLIILAAA